MPNHLMSVSLYKRGMRAGIKADAVPATKHPVSMLSHFSESQREEKRRSTDPQRKKVSPRFFRRIGADFLRVGNPSEKLRIGTLPKEEALVHKPCAEYIASTSEIYTNVYSGQSYHHCLLPPVFPLERKLPPGEAEEAKKCTCRRQRRTPEKVKRLG